MGNRTERFRVLAVIALADGRLEAAERKMLMRCASWLGLNPRQAKDIVRALIAAGRVDSLTVPADPVERESLFNAVINVALADGHLAAHEELCLRNLALPVWSPRIIARRRWRRASAISQNSVSSAMWWSPTAPMPSPKNLLPWFVIHPFTRVLRHIHSYLINFSLPQGGCYDPLGGRCLW